MHSLTQILDKPIYDPDREIVGTLHDALILLPAADTIAALEATRAAGEEAHPPIVGLVVRPAGALRARDPQDRFLAWELIQRLDADGVHLGAVAHDLPAFSLACGQLALRAHLLDRQIVDLLRRRVVRVNDVDLAERDARWRLVAVDTSPAALLRRLGIVGLGSLTRRVLARRTGLHPEQSGHVDWVFVVPVGESDALGLGARLARLDPSDLARVISTLAPRQASGFLDSLGAPQAADTLEALPDEQQAQLLRALHPERAADLLEAMEPDEAADALQALQEVADDAADDLLDRMEPEEAAEVAELLAYPPTSAGGLMTTDYVSVPVSVTVGAVVAALRSRAHAATVGQDDPVPESLPELYVVDEHRHGVATVTTVSAPPTGPGAPSSVHPSPPAGIPSLTAEGTLMGVVQLSALVVATPDAPLAAVMQPVKQVAHPLDDARQVAHVMADADLLALPVVDDAGVLLGMVTVDDAMDVILPDSWKLRPPRRFRRWLVTRATVTSATRATRGF